MNISFIFIALG